MNTCDSEEVIRLLDGNSQATIVGIRHTAEGQCSTSNIAGLISYFIKKLQ